MPAGQIDGEGELDEKEIEFVALRELHEETGYDEKLVREIVRKIDLNEYKRKQAPPCLRVTTKAFGIGRRVPIAQKYVER